MSRLLNKDETQEIINIHEPDISEKLLMELFAKMSLDKPPKYNTNDYFILPKNTCCDNKEGHTTIGIFLFNRFINEATFPKLLGYMNWSMDGKKVEDLEATIAKALYDGKIDTNPYADFLDRMQWLGGNAIGTIISPSITAGILIPPPSMVELKKKLIDKHKDKIAVGDVTTAIKIENELVKHTADSLKDDVGYENFASKAKASIDNNLKSLIIMKGPVQNNITGEYKINFSEYNSGISKDEYASIADSAVAGAFARAEATAIISTRLQYIVIYKYKYDELVMRCA